MRLFFMAAVVAAASAARAEDLPPPLPAQALSDRWPDAAFFSQGILPAPFSFRYGDQGTTDFLGTWVKQQTLRPLDSQRLEQTITFTDPANILQVRCVAVQYRDFPVVEWRLDFKNVGAFDTKLISNVQAIDMSFPVNPNVNTNQLHYFNGGGSSAPYAPFVATLTTPETFISDEPAPDRWLPCFNFDGDSQGVSVALGWPGSWKVSVSGDPGKGWQVSGGLKATHFVLHPGEEVRGPLVALLFWQDGDWIDGQNLWRRWMLAHNLPMGAGGRPLPPRLIGTGDFNSTVNARALSDGSLRLDAWLMKDNGAQLSSSTAEFLQAHHLQPVVSLAPEKAAAASDAKDRVGIAEMTNVAAAFADDLAAQQGYTGWPGVTFAHAQPAYDLLSLRAALSLANQGAETPLMQQHRLDTLALWDPAAGGFVQPTDAYAFRSSALGQSLVALDPTQAEPSSSTLGGLLHRWRVVSPLLAADFYPLTPDSSSETDWLAWQFNDPQKGLGVIQAFRRAQAPGATLTVKLRGLDAAATYELTDVDRNKTDRLTGAQLIQNGYTITATRQPDPPLVQYGKVQP